ncbi:hypothetical protein G7Z17_g9864 [Cylindrodendrum hubeiense]|uniref:Uncharacterized protein n=1 Tax=Cylindrodendrum hubeiense TaxID=595255 RepID=A0A9P5L5A7_9HYPO|nr:hypothetical protein G7Z17_g9864 [Cylindrodendrum hubeiense]
MEEMENRLGVLRLAAARSRHLVVGVGRLVGFSSTIAAHRNPNAELQYHPEGPRVARMRSITIAVIRVVGVITGRSCKLPKAAGILPDARISTEGIPTSLPKAARTM